MKPSKELIFSLRIYLTVIYLATAFFLSPAFADSGLQKSGSFKIAIFLEDGFPSDALPASSAPVWLCENLKKIAQVTCIDSLQLADRSVLNTDNVDLLILPYGGYFPHKAFGCIKEYLSGGGGFFSPGGLPFWKPVDKINGAWVKVDGIDPYKEFLSVLGIKYREGFDNEDTFLLVTTGLGVTPVQPTRGNVFPYRVPVRDFLSWDFLGYGAKEKSVTFVKSWRNAYSDTSKSMPHKWCLVGTAGKNNPFTSRDARASADLNRIIRYLSFPVVILGLETDLAAYYPGEEVRASLKTANNSDRPAQVTVYFKFTDAQGRLAYRKRTSIILAPHQTRMVGAAWRPQEFTSSFYRVSAMLQEGETVFDKEENGFVVINNNRIASSPSLKRAGNGFRVNNKDSLLVGTNYYESKDGELMWVRPNLLRVRRDFQEMRRLKMNIVRIHYHHSKWFRDYYAGVLKKELDPYFNATDTTCLPSTRSLRILDAVIQLAGEQGLIFCMDLFSLVPEEMGDPVGWLSLKERITDVDKVSVQKKFIKLIAGRYRNVAGITWDLWNEPRLEKEDTGLLKSWAKELIAVFRSAGDRHLITIGDDMSLALLDVLDYGCIHTDVLSRFRQMNDFSKPVIFQEIWLPAGYSLSEQARQFTRLKADYHYFLRSRAAGFLPWQWTRQARLWNNASEAEKWDDELGVFAHDDGSLKYPAQEYLFLSGQRKK